MADPIKRLNYFKHQFLKVEDFVAEQNYHIDMRRRHNRYLHTWGVAGDGLKVTFAQGATEVKVSRGMAVDSEGREIVLLEDRTLQLSGFQDNAPVYIVISYTEKKSDTSTETGAEGERRWTEEPNLRPSTDKPATDAGTNILLAKVNRNVKTVAGVDETDRRAAGVETGELTVRRLTLRPTGEVDVSAWPRLSCSAANQVALENGSLKLDINREIVFTDFGQIRSFDNAHRIFFNRLNNRLEFYEFGDVLFLTGGASPTEKLRIRANGNVGIGNTAPDAQLHISGGQWDVTNTEGDFKIGNAATRLKIGVATGGGGAGDVRVRSVGGTNRLHLGSGTTDTLTIVGGNVGIGTIAPNRPLTIQGSAGTYMNVKGNNGDTEVLLGADAGGGIVSTMTNHDLQLRAGNNSTRMIIKADGKVGIGTTTPGFPLTFSNDLGEKISLWGQTGNNYGFGIQGGLLQIYTDGAGSDIAFGFGSSGAFTETMRVKGNGLVGIGTTQPGARLEINNGDLLLKAAGEDPGDIIFQNASGVQKGRIWSSPGTGAALFFSTADNVPRLWINSAGDVTVRNGLYAGNSDIYFTETNHSHTGIGNTAGFAAIENAVNFGALMILGRTLLNPFRRVVHLFDFLQVNGDLTVTGTLRAPSKQGFIVDDFVNRYGDALEQGDVVVVGENQSSLFYGMKSNLPVPEVDIAQSAYDTRVCGIVNELLAQVESQPSPDPSAPDKGQKKASKGKTPHKDAEPQILLAPPQKFTPEELENLDSTKVGPGQFGSMVTHGAYAFCKVDADIAPVEVGDLLTTSPTKGHAQKVLDQSKAVGAVVGKALGSLKKGKGKIPVLVTLQ